MKRILRRAAAMALLLGLALIAPAAPAGAAALSGRDPLLRVAGAAAFEFVPSVNSEYAVYLFGVNGAAVESSATLSLDGETVASGEGRGALLTAWLAAGETYELQVDCSGPVLVEVARSALSRCFDDPLAVEENVPAGKMIARAYDAHWYAFEAAADGALMLTCVPEAADLALSAVLFDESGTRISTFESLPGGACMLLAKTEAGRRYLVRVSAPGGETGYYYLNLHRRAGGAITSALRFGNDAPQTVAAGSAIDLSRLLDGEALLWASDAPGVVAVNQSGMATGLAAGTANVTAYGMGSQATCRVEVVEVALRELRILNARIEVEAGGTARATLAYSPRNASDREVSFEIADPEIAAVSADGTVTGLAPGETTLTATHAASGLRATAPVRVALAGRKYRALLVGEQRYPFGTNSERRGSGNSVEAIAGLLRSGRFETTQYEVRTGTDLSRAELIAELRAAFGGAKAGDVSLLYITCHGNYTAGMSFLELSDGSQLSARDLERELRRVPGTVVVLIDCCGSGGAIGAASERAAFAQGITGAFSGASIRGSRYRVLCSAGLDEDSFRLAFNADSGAGVMATVFARALCDGAGWDIDRGARGTMGADADYDGAITLAELTGYMAGRVDWYLNLAGELTGESYCQSVHAYPEGSPFILFE